MEWKKVTPELKKLLETGMESFASDKKSMFGAPTYFKNGNMFAGIHGDSIIVRLSDKDIKEVLKTHQQVRPFEPVKGRIMKEYLALPQSIYSDKALLSNLLNRAHKYASSLPAKKPKNRPSKNRPN
jgi:TfoX/Sxy family transcriptional regulator of competence genes